MRPQLQKKKLNELMRLVSECHQMCLHLYFKQEAGQLERLLTSKEIVERYFISNRTLQRYRSSKKLLPVSRGRYYLYQEETVEVFFKEYRKQEKQ